MKMKVMGTRPFSQSSRGKKNSIVAREEKEEAWALFVMLSDDSCHNKIDTQ
jgi:hypothetical protein